MPYRKIVDRPLPTIHFKIVCLQYNTSIIAKSEDHVIEDNTLNWYSSLFHSDKEKGLAECMAPRALVGPLEG